MTSTASFKEKNYPYGIQTILKKDLYYYIKYTSAEQARLYIFNNHVFRFYMSPNGIFHDYPIPNNPDDNAKITVKTLLDYGIAAFTNSVLTSSDEYYVIETQKIGIVLDKISGVMRVFDKRSNKDILKETQPLLYTGKEITQTLSQRDDEYFYGGGMQNGRFSHKGESISIMNTNVWVDGGVSSPCPFYWSSYGYGVLRNTWQPGIYNFGLHDSTVLTTSHKCEDFDAFYFINPQPADILRDYYELTGMPIFLPQYAYYEAHLNTFNRDYWVKVSSKTPGAILFEDGHYYKSYKPRKCNVGILESLNGENKNYQFSARAMIDRYKRHDMPLGWFVPNDGYGSGYGQALTLNGDLENLREFVDYAKSKGVEVALWTESQLEPIDPQRPKKGERDLAKEVGVAGIVALKCDVAWIGSGYSFALSAIEEAAKIFLKHRARKIKQKNQRLFILTVDGWAGTQRYAAVWSGDQSGGNWEYIRFHIPTYIGSGLSGQPVVGSDMDGIYQGGVKEVNIRDYQWKTFTPLQLNMDGWGKVPKTPFAFDYEATSLNRAYLKLKSNLLPYNYTIGYEATHGLPMIRAMFLEFPNEPFAYTADTQYQYMWGPSLLVAPVYNSEPVRNGIFLPDPNQVWIDFFTGDKYQGGRVLNNFQTPLWKIPVFIKDGAIIPKVNNNNNPGEILRFIRIFTIYPNGETHFKLYEDDGISSDYLNNSYSQTDVTVIGPKTNKCGDLIIIIPKTVGSYNNQVYNKKTILHILTTTHIVRLKGAINGKSLDFKEAKSEEEFNNQENVYFYKKDYMSHPHLRYLQEAKLNQGCLLISIEYCDVRSSEIHLKILGFMNRSPIFGNYELDKNLVPPRKLSAVDDKVTPTSITLQWEEVYSNYYEIEKDAVIYTNIPGWQFTFDNMKPQTAHTFRIRCVKKGFSEWSNEIVVSTKEDSVIKGVKVSCNIPCQPHHEVCHLTNLNQQLWWHTHWDMPKEACPKSNRRIILNFDIGKVLSIDKIQYIPREDAGNGTILYIQYKSSVDGDFWSELSHPVKFLADNSCKNVYFHGTRMRYFQMHILDSVGGFGSGRKILFHEAKDTETLLPNRSISSV